MKNALLVTEKQSVFLKENRQDPITGDEFCLGDKVVFCASCKSAFLADSWEYMGGKHCGQTRTLNKFPVVAKLKLSKPVVLTFRKADTNNRILAYVIDVIIAIAFGSIIFLLVDNLMHNVVGVFGFIFANLYMLFRDVIGKKSSLGKRIMGLYFINTQTHNIASPLVLLFRNLFYWICLFVAFALITFLEVIIDAAGMIASILGFVLLIANIVHLIVVLANQENIFDNILKIDLVEKNKN